MNAKFKAYQKEIEKNRSNSLAHYSVAEISSSSRTIRRSQRFREALNGESSSPHGSRFWSHIKLGDIFTLTGQKERAANEYRHSPEH